MSVRILEDAKTGEVVVWTSCLTATDFVSELASALVRATAADEELLIGQALVRAMPIMFKLSGYKADEVVEQRTLYCGVVSPDNCTVIGKAGKE